MKILRAILLIGLASTPHWACTNDNNSGPSADFFVSTGQGFLLRVGDTAGINGGELVVSFANVLSDNRCPTDAVCVQAGAAVIQLTVASLDRQDDVTLNVPPGADVDFIFDGFNVNIAQLNPDTSTTAQPPVVDYTVGIIVTNAP